ncbi:MAG: metal ABC transporter solute-binding protein, Zn/Mn family, partial [Campylobacteraceae bacterium]
FHPSWGHFAHRYDLEQISVEIEGKEPKPAELIALVKLAKDENIKVLFIEPQISQKNANIIAKEIGAKTVMLDPLVEDIAKNLDNAAEALLKVK